MTSASGADLISITLNGAPKSLTVDQKVTQVCEEIYPDQMKPGPKAIVICRINGEIKDLWSDLRDGDVC